MQSDPFSLSKCDPIWLLWCDGPRAKTFLEDVSRALIQSTDPEGEIVTLLGDSDWRCHLVAGVALVISEYKTFPQLVKLLWGALDGGSWVSPQLAVCLASIDPDFSVQAKTRIENGCPVVVPPPPASNEAAVGRDVEQSPHGMMSRLARVIAGFLKLQKDSLPPLGQEMAKRHTEQGPDGPVERSAKTLSALVYLCSLRPECEPWLDQCRADPTLRRLLAVDLHHGDKIAEEWSKQFSDALSAFRFS